MPRSWLRSTTHALIGGLALATASACPADDDTAGSASGSGSDSGSATDSAGSEGSDGSESASGGSDSGDSGSSSGASSSSGTGDSATTSQGPAACGEATCAAGQVCVNPCCGGAGPVCYAPTEGMCDEGDTIVDGSQCVLGTCNEADCCLPQGGCEAPPPYCVDAAEVSCEGTNCSVDDCFGNIDGAQLSCLCA